MKNKTLKNPFGNKPHGWIQFKGTDICIDLHCDCGESCHYDGDFLYYFKCPYCGKYWGLNGHIRLEDVGKSEAENGCLKLPEKAIEF